MKRQFQVIIHQSRLGEVLVALKELNLGPWTVHRDTTDNEQRRLVIYMEHDRVLASKFQDLKIYDIDELNQVVNEKMSN